jgi:serine/threonine protein kinase
VSDLASSPRCGANVDSDSSCTACMLTLAMTPPAAPDLTGMQIGHYEIGPLLGRGGMGAVYEAFDPRLERTVAFKILGADFDASAQLVREACLMASLDHKHIVPVYEVEEHEGIAFITMKRVHGGRLATPEPPADSKGRKRRGRHAAEITQQIAQAVDFAHRHGILHRDLKPANVLVEDGQAFVSDFGIAVSEALTAGTEVDRAGSPHYMAPEVWRRDPGAASTAADVWGVGVILHELLRGHPPFDSSSREGLERQVTAEPPPPLVGVDPDLAAVCLHCLEKDPSRRYATAGALAVDLAQVLANEPVSQEARPRGRFARGLRHAERHPVIAALSALFILAGLLAILNALSLSRAREAAFRGADVTARSLA